MKILEDAPTRLVIEENPVVLRIICIGLFVTFLGLGLLFQPIFTLISTGPVTGNAGQDGWVIAQWAITASAIFPLMALVFLVKTRRLTCDHDTRLVTLERHEVWGCDMNEYPLKSLVGAGIQHSFSSSGGRTSRAVLEFTDGHDPVPIKPYYQSGAGPERMAVKINEWLLKQHMPSERRFKAM
ncbi:hypothetical protein E2K80_10855 [Rhodophyticola sp. CCM32]|uniref:hypothetical protein n=1 Tax=Rhodophyticola sp. CCM32 TaxID=2916397 RepID=UPI00107FC063|nr:hypothetical protein [Rhodophyticola sp. CCM32]QBY01162.1 hypothetical protein E2K80_10855 [Rhodophyticola sp. CCM32]